MRERVASIRKQCPPHKWSAVADAYHRGWDVGEALYAMRKCDECKNREHAVIAPEVLSSTPRSMWHLADASWTAV